MSVSDAERVLREEIEQLREAAKLDGRSLLDFKRAAEKHASENVRLRDEVAAALRAPQQPTSDVLPVDVRAPVDEDLPPCTLCGFSGSGAFVQRHVWMCGDCDEKVRAAYTGLSRHMPTQPCVDVAKLMKALTDHATLERDTPGLTLNWLDTIRGFLADSDYTLDAATVRAERDKWWRGKLEGHTYAALHHTKRLTSGNVSHCKPNIERRLNAIRALAPKERSDG